MQVTLKRKRRYGHAYMDKPWIVEVSEEGSNDVAVHRFREEADADEFIAGFDPEKVRHEELE